METIKSIPNLKNLSTLLLENSTDQNKVESVIQEIYLYFHELTEMSNYEHEIKHLAAVPTAKGMALSLKHAADCFLDYKRTVKFLQGMVEAIKAKQEKYPDEKIQIFYAGCGPFAPFVTLVAPLFEPEEIQFSLLDINEGSIGLAKKLISTLKLSSYVQDFHLADAIIFKIPSPDSFHIVFSETLDAVLNRESYVPILWNMPRKQTQQVNAPT